MLGEPILNICDVLFLKLIFHVRLNSKLIEAIF